MRVTATCPSPATRVSCRRSSAGHARASSFRASCDALVPAEAGADEPFVSPGTLVVSSSESSIDCSLSTGAADGVVGGSFVAFDFEGAVVRRGFEVDAEVSAGGGRALCSGPSLNIASAASLFLPLGPSVVAAATTGATGALAGGVTERLELAMLSGVRVRFASQCLLYDLERDLDLDDATLLFLLLLLDLPRERDLLRDRESREYARPGRYEFPSRGRGGT